MSASPATPNQGNKRPKKRWFAYFGANSLAISILIHVLFGVGATFLIVEHFQKKHINFHATEPPSSHSEVEHKVQLAKRNNVESAPPDLKRIVTTDVSAITLPEPPDLPNDTATPSDMNGVDGVMGTGLGSGGGGGGGGGTPLFGAPDGIGMEGVLYDLKQTSVEDPTGIEDKEGKGYFEVLSKYISEDWPDSQLDHDYYKASTALYADSFEIRSMASENATKAFHVEKEVHASFWIALYHGRVAAPQSGEYRFAGYADNVMAVRINGKNVLDAGLNLISPDARLHENLPFIVPYSIWSHLKIGPPFHMEAGKPVDMDVLIGDAGGSCAFLLLVEKEGNKYEKAPDGTPKYPFFQLSAKAAPTFQDRLKTLPYSLTPEPWQLVGD